MKHIKKNENDIEMKKLYTLLNKLIKDNKIKFDFYNGNNTLDLLQLIYNKKDDTIELEFRNIYAEYIEEFKKLNSKNLN